MSNWRRACERGEVAGSGTLGRLVDTARDYARASASENTLKAYAKVWTHTEVQMSDIISISALSELLEVRF